MVILEWRPVQHPGALLGFAKIEMPSGMILCDVPVMNGQNGVWASAPSKPMVGRDGTVQKDANGRTRYQAIIEFVDRGVRDRWSNAVIEVLRQTHPGALP